MIASNPSCRSGLELWLLLGCSLVLLSSSQAIAQTEGLEIREGTGIPLEVRNIYRKGADYLAKVQKDNGSWSKNWRYLQLNC